MLRRFCFFLLRCVSSFLVPITTEPPANAPPNGSVRAIWSGSYLESAWSTGMWLLTTGTPGAGDLSALATDLYGAFQTTFLGPLSSSCSLLECTVHYFNAGEELTASSSAVHTGGDESEIIAVNTASVISWTISTRYRGGKPRNYLCGVSQAALGGTRQFTDGYVASQTTHAATFLSTVNGLAPGSIETVTLGVVHFFRHGAALAPPTFDPFIAGKAQKRVCSQRRRSAREFA